jgi:hypothetical protein
MELPEHTEIRIDSADFTDIQPAEYRADLVIQLVLDKPVLGIVVEVQLNRDDDKGYTWPVYVFNLRSRLRCPAWLLVIAPDEAVARLRGADITELNGIAERLLTAETLQDALGATSV